MSIEYKIIYKEERAVKEILFENFFNGPVKTEAEAEAAAAAAAAAAFKTALKNLLVKQDTGIVKTFIEQLVKVATINEGELTDNKDNFPFIFVIDTTSAERSQRTYLTFSGDNANPKVNFNQYNVEETLKTAMDKAFEVLIKNDYKYNYYNKFLIDKGEDDNKDEAVRVGEVEVDKESKI